MGLIRAVTGAVGHVLQEQWKEFIVCDAMGPETLIRRAWKRISDGSANDRRDDNVLTNGSLIVVADGQCVIVVSQGKIVDVCSEPGEHVFIDPNRAGGVKGFLNDVGSRIGFGGVDVQPVTHRVYYVNLLEITGNSFATPEPVPFQVSDGNIALDADLSVMIEGMFSYRVSDPVKLYRTLSGNVASSYSRTQINSQMTSCLLMSLQSALSRLAASGLRPHEIPEHIPELSDGLREVMSGGWAGEHGLEVSSMAISSLRVMNAGEVALLQRNAVLRDPVMAGAHMTGAAAQAMQTAAANPSGGRVMLMPLVSEWTCSCGTVSGGRFCPECGTKGPEEWVCSCGQANWGNYCTECGLARPETWLCPCGQENTGKFCTECGQPRPAGIP